MTLPTVYGVNKALLPSTANGSSSDVCCIPAIFHRVRKIREGALQYHNPRASREVSAARSHTQLDLCKINSIAATVQCTEISHPRVTLGRPPQCPPTFCKWRPAFHRLIYMYKYSSDKTLNFRIITSDSTQE